MENDTVKAKRLPFSDIIRGMRSEIEPRYLDTKRKGGNDITFIPWYQAQRLLTKHTNGFWHYEIKEKRLEQGHFLITVRISIEAEEGLFFREGTGIEAVEGKGADDKSYGEFSSNAEAMAFRRACAHFGLGLYLYEKK